MTGFRGSGKYILVMIQLSRGLQIFQSDNNEDIVFSILENHARRHCHS